MIYSNYDLNKFLDNFFNNSTSQNFRSTILKSKLEDENYEVNYTNDGAYLILEVPGFNKTNLKVELENGFVFIEGKRILKMNGDDIERTVNKKFQIGDGYKAESMEATIEDGLLTLFVPNMKKQQKKKINIM